MSSHPAIHEAASRALRDFGPHSAGSPCLLGNTKLSLQLEEVLGEKLRGDHVVLFPTGWAAGFGTIISLVRPRDYIVMDHVAHACLQQGAFAATSNVIRHKHLDVDEVRSHLQEIRGKDAKCGILVVTEGLFSMDSDTPDILALQEVSHEYGATLMVDIAHDFGALGPSGTGHIGLQGMLGKVDLVMGSFSKTFASNGGFVVTRSESVKQFLKWYGGPHIFSNALSPVQAAIVLEVLRIADSEEGGSLRGALMTAVNSLRARFAEHDIHCIGDPSAIVPVPVGSEALARVTCALLYERNVHVNLVEYPAVAVGKARFRMQVMANHTPEHTSRAVDVIVESLNDARSCLAD